MKRITEVICCAMLWCLSAFAADRVVVLRSTTGAPAQDVVGGVLTRYNAKLLKKYQAFDVYRISSDVLDQFQTEVASQGILAEVRDDFDKVYFPSRTVDVNTPPSPTASTISEGLYVVKFAGPIAEDWQDELLSTGVTVVGYIPTNTQIVAAPEATIEGIRGLPFVTWVDEYRPEYKEIPQSFTTYPTLQWYYVEIANVPAAASTLARLAGLDHVDGHDFGVTRYVGVRTDSSTARALLNDPFVVQVTPVGAMRLSSEREAVAQTESTSSTTRPWQAKTSVQYFTTGQYYDSWRPYLPSSYTTYNFYAWLNQKSVRDTSAYTIALADSGFDSGMNGSANRHPDFATADAAGRLIWKTYGTSDDCGDDAGHGTMVGGLILGYPDQANGQRDSEHFLYGEGVAPLTKLYIQKVFDSSGAWRSTDIPGGSWSNDLTTVANDAYVGGAFAMNASFNDSAVGAAGTYTAEARQLDFIVRDSDAYYGNGLQPIAVVEAAGNIGEPDATSSVEPPATAKNVITVGATETYLPAASNWTTCDVGTRNRNWQYADGFNNLAYFSRRGTNDNRLKPEILAPGTQVISQRSQYGTKPGYCKYVGTGSYYTGDSGTSFSAPQATAALALIKKKFAGAALSPALFKAALIGSAIPITSGVDRYRSTSTSLVRVAARPNTSQGFGRFDLSTILTTPGPTYVDEGSVAGFTAAGQSQSYTVTVSDQTKPTVVVLAYSDSPATTGANPSLVRDLSLRVTSGAHSYFGNYMSNDVSIDSTTGTVDHANNVEIVVIPANTISSFTVTVSCDTWAFEGGFATQKYALFYVNGY